VHVSQEKTAKISQFMVGDLFVGITDCKHVLMQMVDTHATDFVIG
jgi:hypothetical protein